MWCRPIVFNALQTTETSLSSPRRQRSYGIIGCESYFTNIEISLHCGTETTISWRADSLMFHCVGLSVQVSGRLLSETWSTINLLVTLVVTLAIEIICERIGPGRAGPGCNRYNVKFRPVYGQSTVSCHRVDSFRLIAICYDLTYLATAYYYGHIQALLFFLAVSSDLPVSMQGRGRPTERPTRHGDSRSHQCIKSIARELVNGWFVYSAYTRYYIVHAYVTSSALMCHVTALCACVCL